MKLNPFLRGTLVAASTAMLAGFSLSAHAQPIKLVNLLEMSGGGASVGTNYNNGVLLAAKEINDAGGVLGRKFEITTLDTQTQSGIAKALALRAVDMDAFAVVGPTFSGSVIVSMTETKNAGIPNFTGAAAASITASGHPTIIRTHMTQAASVPKVARYLKDTVKAKKVDVVYALTDMGKGGRDEFIKSAKAMGLEIGADVSTEPQQIDFSSVVHRVKRSGSDALFAYVHEEESARLLRELKKQGYDKLVIGDTTLVNQKVIELAGDAANGAVAHVSLTADGPEPTVKAFDEKFQRAYKYKGDHNAVQGYMVPYMIKAVSEKMGKIDAKAFTAALKSAPLYAKDHPGVLLDMKYDQNGDADRSSYLVQVKNGKQEVLAVLPPANKF